MAADEYIVRLAPSPVVAEAAGVQPRRARRSRRARRWIALLALTAVGFVFREPLGSWAGVIADRAKTPVEAFQADGELRNAALALEDLWRDDQSYAVGREELAARFPDVAWGEAVRYRSCLGGRAAIFSADATAGTVTRLHVRGTDHGAANGEHGCPASLSDLAPWGEL